MNPRDDAELAEWMGRFYADPLGFVMFAYPWDSDPALQLVALPAAYRGRFNSRHGPDLWACEFLEQLGAEVRSRGFDGRRAVPAIRMAVASGHGIGKSALTAWLVNWILSTRPHAKGIVTANTQEQLAGKTWAEICKWTRKSVTAHWWQVRSGKAGMRISHCRHPESWQARAQTCREDNAEAFAGLHAADSTPFYLFDEASAIPDAIAEVAEGGLTDGEPMFFKFGNPTRNSGNFHRSFHGQRHRWLIRHIDSRSTAITNKQLLAEWQADYGEDSDFFKVRVRGLFPALSVRAFISTADADAAYGRELAGHQFGFAPKILTCDPAWEGDDELVIGLRQGLLFKILAVIAKNDNDIDVANRLARLQDQQQADAVFIDAGYGTGIVSAGRSLGRDWQLVWFAGQSQDPGCVNKRAEIWKAMRDWLKQGGCIPRDPQLLADLTAPETVPRLDGKLQLESKQDMKRRRLPSPNRADALALSFAYPVQTRPAGTPAGPDRRDYDPFTRF